MRQLKKTLEDLNEEYGENTIFTITDMDCIKVEKFPSGIASIDEITGGGIPRGCITELFGNESSGKTTLALKLVSIAQQTGTVAYIDMEHALDLQWAESIGVNTRELLLSQPSYAEQALDIVIKLIETGKISLIVVDSVAALVPKSELEGEIGDASIGVVARLMSQMMRKITAVLKKSNTALVFINQQRLKIGQLYGNPEVTCGGVALKFYASLRLHLSRTEIVKVKTDSVAVEIKAKVVKNKIAPPFKVGTFRINFNGKVE